MITISQFEDCLNCGKQLEYVRVHAVIAELKDQLFTSILMGKAS
jgi:hypothetical protein